MKHFFFISIVVYLYQNAYCSCPTNYQNYMGQCYFIIKDQVDYVTAHNNCSQVNGNLVFTKTQLGWDNLVNSGWDIEDQMWFGLTYDSSTESYSFDDNSPYSFNGSFYMPWQSASEAQNPNTYYGYSDMYCVQVQKANAGDNLALFVLPCTDVASAVCLIGTLETNQTLFPPPPPPPPKNGAESCFYFHIVTMFLLIVLVVC